MKYFILSIAFVISLSAYANEESLVEDPQKNEKSFESFMALAPHEIFARTQAVLNYFELPPETSNEDSLAPFQRATSLSEMQEVLAIYDAEKQLARFVSLGNNSMEVFEDRDGHGEKDFQIQNLFSLHRHLNV